MDLICGTRIEAFISWLTSPLLHSSSESILSINATLPNGKVVFFGIKFFKHYLLIPLLAKSGSCTYHHILFHQAGLIGGYGSVS